MRYIAMVRKDLNDPRMRGWQILLASALGLSILASVNKMLFFIASNF